MSRISSYQWSRESRRRAALALSGATAFGLALGFAAGPAAAQTPPPDGGAVVQRILERNATQPKFTAKVHVRARMLNFPYVAQRLEGTSSFTPPDSHEAVFERVPGYAKSFSRVFEDAGDPAFWAKDQQVFLDGMQTLPEGPAIVLRLTKKGARVARTLVFVDALSYVVREIEWDYANGGKITIHQSFRGQAECTQLASQHAVIDIPHARAIADATYDGYQSDGTCGQ